MSRPKTDLDGQEANRTATSKENHMIQKVSINQKGLSVKADRLHSLTVFVVVVLAVRLTPSALEGSSIVALTVEFINSHFNWLILCWKSGSVSRQNDTIDSKITDTDITAITRAQRELSGYSNNNHNWRWSLRSGSGWKKYFSFDLKSIHYIK